MEKKKQRIGSYWITYVTGVTKEQYDRYKTRCNEDLWDFSLEDIVNGAIEINEEIVYCLIYGRMCETNFCDYDDINDIEAELERKEFKKTYKFCFVKSVEFKAKDLNDAVKHFSEIVCNAELVEATCITDDKFVTDEVLKLLEAEN